MLKTSFLIPKVRRKSCECWGGKIHHKTSHAMSVKIEKIEGNFEVIGYYLNGVKVKESKRRITNWK